MADENFRAVTTLTARCKCCDGTARVYGVVDFNKNCEVVHNRHPLGASGIPVYYHRCPQCALIFTTFTDSWTHAEFAKNIYNDEYALVDPEYADKRPRNAAVGIGQLWGHCKEMRILDYGGGNGLTARVMRENGFKHVEVYDPFTPEFATKPPGKFDIITAIEVLEHTPTPRETVTDIASMLADAGVVMASTMFQPQNIDQLGVGWWYLAPRNGHVSLYTQRAMTALTTPLGLKFGSFNEGMHLMVRGKPSFTSHINGL